MKFESCQIFLTQYKWEKHSDLGADYFYIGNIDIDIIKKQAVFDNSIDKDFVCSYLLGIEGCYALVIKCPNAVFVAVDRINSHPIYLSKNALYDAYYPEHMSVTSNRKLLLNYLMSGYVFGSDTLCNGVKQLRAGEYALLRANSFEVKTYYFYRPVNLLSAKSTGFDTNKLGSVVDKAISRVIKQADGQKILLPLSGGLDSRLILAKLVEKRYDNIYAFTYGVPGSHEAKMAKWVCERLNVRWHFLSFKDVDTHSREFCNYFEGYIASCPLHVSMPSILEVVAFYLISKNMPKTEKKLVVNGQTGDFITGGHINLEKMNAGDQRTVFNFIINKHCAFWPKLLCDENIRELSQTIIESHDEFQCLIKNSQDYNILSFYEYWEWRERQSKFVVSGQRLYDSLGYDWALPFWDKSMMDYWAQCPVHLKLNQKHYIDYLKQYNFKQVFDVIRLSPNPWVGRYKLVKYAARALQFTLGKKTKQYFYKYMDYYSTYHNQYALLDRVIYKKYWRDIRNPGSLLSYYGLEKLGINLAALLEKTRHELII